MIEKLNGIIAILIGSVFVWFLLPLQTQCFAADPELISLEEFKSMVDSDADMVIVDTRIGISYDAGHIPGAISMHYPTEIRTKNEELPRDKTIVLYCS